MLDLVEALRLVNLFAFAVLALVALRLYLERRDPPSFWTLAAMATLAVVATVGRITSEMADSGAIDAIRRADVMVLLIFPYCLYRIATSFERRSGPLGIAGLVALGALVAWTLVLPELPQTGEARPRHFGLYILAILAYWTVLSVAAGTLLWRAGTDQPPVTRARMRLLATGAVVLSIAIVLSGATSARPDRFAWIAISVQMMALISSMAFLFAFAAPAWLRHAWRRLDQERVQEAAITMLEAEGRDDVVQRFLPAVADLLAASAVRVLDNDSAEIASFRKDGGDGEGASSHSFDFPFGKVIVEATPYTPFFGEDDIALVGALGAFASLALQRLEAGEMRRHLEVAELRRRQALEINDNVVQGLAVAKYAYETGNQAKAAAAVESTLAAARRIISDLVEEIGPDEIFGTDVLVRRTPAAGGGDSPTP